MIAMNEAQVLQCLTDAGCDDSLIERFEAMRRAASRGGQLALLPVVSKSVLPKGKILDCAKELKKVTVKAPVKAGDVVAADILGLGVDIVASRDMAAV